MNWLNFKKIKSITRALHRNFTTLRFVKSAELVVGQTSAMKLFRPSFALGMFAGAVLLCPAAEPKRKEVVELQPFTHEYYWQEFTVSQKQPASADGRYLLQKVRKNGEVLLLDRLHPETPEKVVAVPMPKKPKEGSHPPTIITVSWDAREQSATIRALQMK